MPKSNPCNGLAAPELRTVANDADANPENADANLKEPALAVRATVRANSLKSNAADDADGADANFSPADSALKKQDDVPIHPNPWTASIERTVAKPESFRGCAANPGDWTFPPLS
jgi:hypothetical protein